MSEATHVPDSESAALAATAAPADRPETPAPSMEDASFTPEQADDAVASAIAAADGTEIPSVPDFTQTETRQPVSAPSTLEKEPAAPAEPAEPEATPAPEPEPEAPQEAPWDKARQEKDQLIATQRKQIEQLQAQVKSAEGGAVRGVEEISADLEALTAEPVDEFTPPEDIAERTNKLAALNAELARSISMGQQSGDDVAALDDVLKTVCAHPNVGEEHRNGILAELNRVWDDRGYGPGNMPDAQHVYDIALARGLELAAAAKPAATPAAPVAAAPLDNGTAAPAPPTRPTTGVKQAGSIEAALQDMKNEGLL